MSLIKVLNSRLCGNNDLFSIFLKLFVLRNVAKLCLGLLRSGHTLMFLVKAPLLDFKQPRGLFVLKERLMSVQNVLNMASGVSDFNIAPGGFYSGYLE